MEIKSSELQYSLTQTVDEIWDDCMKLTIELETHLKRYNLNRMCKSRKIIKNFMSYYPDHRYPFPHWEEDIIAYRLYDEDYSIDIDISK